MCSPGCSDGFTVPCAIDILAIALVGTVAGNNSGRRWRRSVKKKKTMGVNSLFCFNWETNIHFFFNI